MSHVDFENVHNLADNESSSRYIGNIVASAIEQGFSRRQVLKGYVITLSCCKAIITNTLFLRIFSR